MLGQKCLGHAVVQLMRSRVVQILAFGVNLRPTRQSREVFKMRDRSWTPLEVFADIAQIADELRRLRDRLIRLADFFEMRFQRGRKHRAAVFTKKTVGVWGGF